MRKMFALNANGQKIYQTVGDFIEYGLRMNVLLWCIWLTLTVRYAVIFDIVFLLVYTTMMTTIFLIYV